MKTLDTKDLQALDIYKILTGAIVPRPIAFISTMNKKGQTNAAPFSFFNGVCSNPPTLSVSIARNSDGSKKDTLINIEETSEFVVNICSESFAQEMAQSSANYAYGTSEIEKTKLSTLPSESISCPRIKESKIHFECKLYDKLEVGDGSAGSSTLVVGEILKVHVSEKVYRDGKINFEKLSVIARLSGRKYGRITETFSLNVEKI